MADITNKNELKRRIELFLDELDYSINEDFCKETMKMMREFIGHVSHRLDCEESRVKSLEKKLKEYKDLEKQGRLIMNATNCTHYETVEGSNAYFLGVRSAEDDAYSRGCLSGIELGKKEVLCGITSEDAKSMICTLDMLKRLAFNIHGVIDVIDDRNIEKMRKVLSQLN